MGVVTPPKPVKLFVGLLTNDRDLALRACQLLARHYGPEDLHSEHWAFDHTSYYTVEMGEGVERQFVSFDRLIQAEHLADIKRETNSIEEQICRDSAAAPGHRPVNLDPGYMSLSKLVLATTKDRAHRIYLRRGIYAESTLRYEQGSWRPWPWTYPDFASGAFQEYFLTLRQRLKAQLAESPPPAEGAPGVG